MEPTFELVQHTADMGVRARASDLPGLVKAAARGLYAIIGELHVDEDEVERVRVSFTGDDPAGLLRDLLAELLYRFENEGRMARRVEVERFEAGELRVCLNLRPVDLSASVLHGEVKAVTYHQLAILPRLSEDGQPFYEALFFVDL